MAHNHKNTVFHDLDELAERCARVREGKAPPAVLEGVRRDAAELTEALMGSPRFLRDLDEALLGRTTWWEIHEEDVRQAVRKLVGRIEG